MQTQPRSPTPCQRHTSATPTPHQHHRPPPHPSQLTPPLAPTRPQVVGAAIKEGLLLVPAGTHVVRFVPPLIVTEKDVTDALAIFSKVVASYAKK